MILRMQILRYADYSSSSSQGISGTQSEFRLRMQKKANMHIAMMSFTKNVFDNSAFSDNKMMFFRTKYLVGALKKEPTIDYSHNFYLVCVLEKKPTFRLTIFFVRRSSHFELTHSSVKIFTS